MIAIKPKEPCSETFIAISQFIQITVLEESAEQS